jgi:hypothetical protein
MNPLLWALRFVFGCHHRHLSRVFTIKQRTYRVCFDCGSEFDQRTRLPKTGQSHM